MASSRSPIAPGEAELAMVGCGLSGRADDDRLRGRVHDDNAPKTIACMASAGVGSRGPSGVEQEIREQDEGERDQGRLVPGRLRSDFVMEAE